MGTVKFGWAENKFVFTKPVSLRGQFAERISEYEEKPLTVTALAVESGDEQMVLCSTDLLFVSDNLVDEVRHRLANNSCGLQAESIILSATHIHTGPGHTGFGVTKASAYAKGIGWGGQRTILKQELPSGKQFVERVVITQNDAIMSDDALFEELSAKITDAVLRAWTARAAGKFSNAFGRAPIGQCRRVCFSDGTAQMWGDTASPAFVELEGGNDSGIELLYIFNNEEKLTGIIANLACPAQCVQHRLFISPDFWGETKMLLRKHFGEDLFLLPLCSAAGDQCPADMVRFVEPESDLNDPNLTRSNPIKRTAGPSMFDLSGMRKNGKRVADEIIAVYTEELTQMQSDAVFTHLVRDLALPLRRVTHDEVECARASLREYIAGKQGDLDFNDQANLQAQLGILQRQELQEALDLIRIETHIVRLGPIVFATNPFELFLNYGNQMKAGSPAEQTFVVQLANGYEGYLPTVKAEKGGHYSGFHASGCVGHEGGELLVQETLAGIRELFK